MRELKVIMSGTAATSSDWMWIPYKGQFTLQVSGFTGTDEAEIHQRFGVNSQLSYKNGEGVVLSATNTTILIQGPFWFKIVKPLTSDCEIGFYDSLE